MDYDAVTGRYLTASLLLGVLGAILYQVVLIPFAALVTGIIGVARNDPGRLTGKWRGWIGIALGAVYTILGLLTVLAWLARVAGIGTSG